MMNNNSRLEKVLDINISLKVKDGLSFIGKRDIEQALRILGIIDSITVSPYTTKSAQDLKKSIWIQIDCLDKTKPLLLAFDQFSAGERVITDEELNYLRKHGVCVHMAGGHYEDEGEGLKPAGQVGHTYATVAGFINTKGFPIDPAWPFDLTCGIADFQGDDEVLCWLKVMIPEHGPF